MALLLWRSTSDAGTGAAFHHTEAPRSLQRSRRGQCVGPRALDDARTRGLTVVPTCSFVSAYISKHPEYLPLVLNQISGAGSVRKPGKR